jgi:hypothetical protein
MPSKIDEMNRKIDEQRLANDFKDPVTHVVNHQITFFCDNSVLFIFSFYFGICQVPLIRKDVKELFVFQFRIQIYFSSLLLTLKLNFLNKKNDFSIGKDFKKDKRYAKHLAWVQQAYLR